MIQNHLNAENGEKMRSQSGDTMLVNTTNAENKKPDISDSGCRKIQNFLSNIQSGVLLGFSRLKLLKASAFYC